MPVTTYVVPVRLEVADALLAGDAVLSQRYGFTVAAGFLDDVEILPAMRAALASGTPPEWFSHLIIHRETLTVVGFGGYKGQPIDGEVEIGYSIAPAHRRRGHATAAVKIFVDRARGRGAGSVSAHTLPVESPSTRVLARSGFTRTEVVVDAELGDLWRWVLLLRG